MSTRSTDTATIVLLLLAAVLVLPLLFMAGGMMWGGPMPGYGPMMGNGGMWGGTSGANGWWVLLGFGMQFLFLLGVLAVAYLAYRRLTAASATDPALEELRSAYARGDLTDDEYEERRDRLERDRRE